MFIQWKLKMPNEKYYLSILEFFGRADLYAITKWFAKFHIIWLENSLKSEGSMQLRIWQLTHIDNFSGEQETYNFLKILKIISQLFICYFYSNLSTKKPWNNRKAKLVTDNNFYCLNSIIFRLRHIDSVCGFPYWDLTWKF